MAFWTDSEIATLKSCLNCDMSIDDIADRLGRNSDSVRAKANRLESENKAPDIQEVLSKNLSEAMAAGFESKSKSAAASLKITMPEILTDLLRKQGDEYLSKQSDEMAKAAGIARQPQAPKVECEWADDEDIADLWGRAEVRNAKHIEKNAKHEQFSVDFPADEPIAISFISDQHIAPGSAVDLRRMREDAEYIRDTPNMYALLVGDAIDGHIKHRAAMIGARSTPGDQYRLFNYYLAIFADKVLAVLSGNHDLWAEQFSGIDMISYIAAKNRICYSHDAFRFKVNVGGQQYKIAARHQFRMGSQFNQTHCVKQWQRLGDEDFDIGAIGHNHEASIECGVYRGQECGYCRPGSYQINTSHGQQYGYNNSVPKCPTFILWPRKREICGFSDLRKAGLMLRSLLR